MAEWTIYHNPRCSKSRCALEMLEEKGIAPTVVEYLKAPLDEAGLKQLLSLLGLKARDIVGYSMLQFVVHVPVVLFLVWILNYTL